MRLILEILRYCVSSWWNGSGASWKGNKAYQCPLHCGNGKLTTYVKIWHNIERKTTITDVGNSWLRVQNILCIISQWICTRIYFSVAVSSVYCAFPWYFSTQNSTQLKIILLNNIQQYIQKQVKAETQLGLFAFWLIPPWTKWLPFSQTTNSNAFCWSFSD